MGCKSEGAGYQHLEKGPTLSEGNCLVESLLCPEGEEGHTLPEPLDQEEIGEQRPG